MMAAHPSSPASPHRPQKTRPHRASFGGSASALVRATALQIAERLRQRQPREPLRARALAQECGVSRTTAMRCLDYLRDELGAPLIYKRTAGGSWMLRRRWRPVLERPEVEDVALLLALERVGRDRSWPADAQQRLADIRKALEERL